MARRDAFHVVMFKDGQITCHKAPQWEQVAELILEHDPDDYLMLYGVVYDSVLDIATMCVDSAEAFEQCLTLYTREQERKRPCSPSPEGLKTEDGDAPAAAHPEDSESSQKTVDMAREASPEGSNPQGPARPGADESQMVQRED